MPNARKKIRLPRSEYGDPERVYFITIHATKPGAPFKNPQFAQEVVNCLLDARTASGFSLYCCCLMPDHLHLVLSPSPHGPDVVGIIRHFKGVTTRKAWRHALGPSLWQRGYYDRIARREEDVLGMCEYILNNPVRAGLSQDHEEYPFCGLIDPI